MQVMTAENFGESKESIGYKGPSKTGKTHNLLTWPAPIYIANFDRNLKTVREAIQNGLDAKMFLFDTIKEFKEDFVHKVLHREFEAQTIGLDTADFMAAMLIKEVQGTKLRMAQSDWGTFLTELRSIFSDLTSAIAPLGDKPSYNLVVNYHMMDVTNDDGALLRTTPGIPGKFKDELEAYLDTILYCTSQISSTAVKQPGGGTKMIPSKQFICHSVAPNQFIPCGGSNLPPTTPGDYPTLRAEWDKKETGNE